MHCRLVTGEWVDAEVEDPLSQMFALLGEKRNRPLVQQWGVWLTNRDPERAMKVLLQRSPGYYQDLIHGSQLLTSSTSNRRGAKSGDDQLVLQQLQETNPAAAAQFLEHLVLSKRNAVRRELYSVSNFDLITFSERHVAHAACAVMCRSAAIVSVRRLHIKAVASQRCDNFLRNVSTGLTSERGSQRHRTAPVDLIRRSSPTLHQQPPTLPQSMYD